MTDEELKTVRERCEYSFYELLLQKEIDGKRGVTVIEENEKVCPVCWGNGIEVHEYSPGDYARPEHDIEPCSRCKGTGKVRQRKGKR